MTDLLTTYIIHHADNALILGHRNSEWTGHGPILEQDIAISNIALDLIGQARNFYQLAASRLNVTDNAQVLTEDDLAYLRDPQEFRNFILVEQLNGDWAHTILRQFYFSSIQFLIYRSLLKCSNPDIAAICEKSIKETRYHLKWSSEWVIRLGDGTDESHERMLNAMETLNPWIMELFLSSDFNYEAADTLQAPLPENYRTEWFKMVNETLHRARLPQLSDPVKSMPMLSGINGIHSEWLTTLLSEMQFLQRAYPGNRW